MPRYDARPRLESGALVFRATFRSGDQGYRPEPGAATVEFSCALDGIDRDTDGDGLTDVLEDWYVTDPASRDTDRDGLSDDVDAMPHVPVTGTPTLRGRALLQAHLEWRQKHGTIRADVGPPQWPGINAAHGDTFIVSSRKDLRGLAPGRRLFVLTAAEAEQARARFGGSHPASRHFVVTNRRGTRIYVSWGSRWGGGAYLLEKKVDGWHVDVLLGMAALTSPGGPPGEQTCP